jgi:hypothetical protein
MSPRCISSHISNHINSNINNQSNLNTTSNRPQNSVVKTEVAGKFPRDIRKWPFLRHKTCHDHLKDLLLGTTQLPNQCPYHKAYLR